MATLTMTPTRQPLGCLDSPHMRPVMRSRLNRQNQQNGTLSLKGAISPMKSSIFIDADSENISPVSHSAKRKRSLDDDEENKAVSKPIKTSRMALSTRSTNISPRISTPLKASTTATPKSAPILKPAGRSPPPKSSKSLTRRSLISKPRSELHGKRGVARPFSLASALARTKAPKPAPKVPASWCFDIHVDTEQEEMTNLMQHSTTVLDISDDEGKADAYSRGKENIPPQTLGLELPSSTATAGAARKAPKMDEHRAPLGELNAADYYAEDCNAFSHVIVYDNEENSPEFKKPSSPLAQSSSLDQSQQALITTSIASVLEAVAPMAAETEVQEEETVENTKPVV